MIRRLRTVTIVFVATQLIAVEKVTTPQVTKEGCISLFKQVVSDVNTQNFTKVFEKIGDGKGSSTVELMGEKAVMAIKKEDGEGFAKKNFPQYDLIEKNLDKITFGELKKGADGACGIKKNRQSVGSGTMYTIEVNMPFITANRERFAALRFVEFKGELYWIPFGW